MAACNGCEIIFANQEGMLRPRDLVEDFVTVTHGSSEWLSGLRRYEEVMKVGPTAGGRW